MVKKVDNIDTSVFVLKTTYDTDKSDLKKIEGKIPSITSLATNSALTAVESKVPDVCSLVKKTQIINKKISDIKNKVNDHNHDKYITTPEVNTLAARVFNTRLAQAYLITKTDFDAKLKKGSDIVTSNKSKDLFVEKELKKLEKIDAACFRSKNYFAEDEGTQHYLVFQPMYRYFKTMNSVDNISEWKYKGLSNKSIQTPSTFNNLLNPLLDYVHAKIRVKFGESCSKQDKATRDPRTIVNKYIVYEISKNHNISSSPTRLFRAVSLTKHTDIDQYKYSGYGIGFDRKGELLFGIRGFGKNIIIFGADMSSSVHASNKTKNILVLGKDFI